MTIEGEIKKRREQEASQSLHIKLNKSQLNSDLQRLD